MSDLADIGSSQLGYANLAASQAGGPAITNQANTAAGTNLLKTQTTGAEIQNQNARLQYNLFANAVGHIHDFDGQDGPSLGKGADDASGVTATSALPGADAPPALKGKITPEMDVGASASDQALIESSLEQNFNVNPAGTPQEQQAIMQASRQAQAWALSGNKGMAEAAQQKLDMMKNLRDMNVATRKNAAQVEASGHYDKLSAVVNAPEGQAWNTLDSIAHDSADNIKRQNPNATPEELEKIARDTSAHVAGFMHRFTDRPVKVGDDQVMYDEKSGQKVDGIPMRGVDPARQADLLKQATEVKTFKNSDGTDTTEEQYKHDGYANPNLWVTHAVNDIRARNAANNALEAAHSKAARVPPQPPGQPGQSQPGQPGQPQPGAPQPGQPGQPQPGQPGQPQPGQPPARPGQQPDNGLLPGVNPDALPKVQSAPVTQGTSQKPGDLKTQEGVAAESLAQQKESNSAFVEAQKNGALIRAAQREAHNLANSPRMTGPGSDIAQGWAKLKTFISGQPPDELVDLGSLDKILLQMGAQNIRQALSGQRITNQEFMTLMTKGNPNTEQPLPTINNLLKYIGAQNEYEQRFQRTKQLALQRGANPMTVDGDIGSQADRGDFVEGKVGVRPPIAGAGGGGGGGGSQQTNAGGASEGAESKSKSGKPIVYKNGHWQYK